MNSSAEDLFDVYLHERCIAKLHRKEQFTRAVFQEDYRGDPQRAVLSLSFEDNPSKNWTANQRLPAWFSNLLPEGKLREWVGTEKGVSVHQEMDLLARLGSDLPGAVRVLRADEPLPERGAWEDLHEPSGSTERGDIWRFSLAGVGLKFSMLDRGERFTAPARGERGDWIVKTPDLLHANVPRNEHAMMSLAAVVGIETPEVRLLHRAQFPELPGNVWGEESHAYAVKRFDRGPERELIHIEDFAQLRAYYPGDKYKGKFETLANLVYRGRDTDSLREFARRLTFNSLIGNGDAHLKNWSLIYRDPRRPVLSPAYDLVATFAYRPEGETEDLGLSFGGLRSFDKLGPATLDKFDKKLKAAAGLADVSIEVARATRENIEVISHLLGASAPNLSRKIETRIRAESAKFLGA